jgi:hypothetical protein
MSCGCERPAWANSPNPGKNCNFSKTVEKAGRFTILGAADGQNFGVEAVAEANGGGRTIGSFLRLDPYGNGRWRLVDILVEGESAGDIGFGEIRHNGKAVQFEMQGSFQNASTPATGMGCQEAKECGFKGINYDCLPDFSTDDTLDVALKSFTGADVTDVDITIVLGQVA